MAGKEKLQEAEFLKEQALMIWRRIHWPDTMRAIMTQPPITSQGEPSRWLLFQVVPTDLDDLAQQGLPLEEVVVLEKRPGKNLPVVKGRISLSIPSQNTSKIVGKLNDVHHQWQWQASGNSGEQERLIIGTRTFQQRNFAASFADPTALRGIRQQLRERGIVIS